MGFAIEYSTTNLFMCCIIIHSRFCDIDETFDHENLEIIMIMVIFTDIDECLVNNGTCEDICINTEGSFYCQCSTGLALSADNRTCEGNNDNYHNS